MEAGPGPRRHLQMGDSGGPSESSGGDGSGKDLPVMPGPEKPLLHIAIEFVEMLDNALAEHQMLNVAHACFGATVCVAVPARAGVCSRIRCASAHRVARPRSGKAISAV